MCVSKYGRMYVLVRAGLEKNLWAPLGCSFRKFYVQKPTK